MSLLDVYLPRYNDQHTKKAQQFECTQIELCLFLSLTLCMKIDMPDLFEMKEGQIV